VLFVDTETKEVDTLKLNIVVIHNITFKLTSFIQYVDLLLMSVVF